MDQGKLGVVSQEFSSGSFTVWCEADKLLYQYHIEDGQEAQPVGTKLRFWHDEGLYRVTSYELQ